MGQNPRKKFKKKNFNKKNSLHGGQIPLPPNQTVFYTCHYDQRILETNGPLLNMYKSLAKNFILFVVVVKDASIRSSTLITVAVFVVICRQSVVMRTSLSSR